MDSEIFAISDDTEGQGDPEAMKLGRSTKALPSPGTSEAEISFLNPRL